MREALTNWARLLPAVESPIERFGQRLGRVLKLLQRVPTLAEIPQLCDKALVQLAAMQDHGDRQLLRN